MDRTVKRGLVDDGVWKLGTVLGFAQRKQLLERLDEYESSPKRYAESLEFEYEPGKHRVRKMRRLAWVDPEPWRILWETPEIAALLEHRFNEPVGVAYCAAFLKPSEVGSGTPYHQDQALWSRELPGAISCWIALDAADECNGCLVFSPGSHRGGAVPHVDSHCGGHPEVAPEVLETLPLEPVPLEAGEAVAWDRYTVHGSGVNRSERKRRAVVSVFAPSRLLDVASDPVAWVPGHAGART